MSDAKPLKKAETTPKPVEAAKPAATTSEAAKSEAPASGTPAKSTASSGGGSQRPISHFSSVSTPEYRSGWESIFGSKKKPEETASNEDSAQELPEKLTLEDADIDADLRALLDKAFELAAKKHGIDLANVRKTSALAYSIDCNMR